MIASLLAWAGALVVAAGAAWSLVRAWRILAIGSSYKAKVLGSLVFGSGRPVDPKRAREVSAESYWPMRFFRARVDRQRRTVTVSFLGLRSRTATYRQGFGATLTNPEETARAEVGRQNGADVATASDNPWPRGDTTAALARVVESAFSEPGGRQLRRTRAVIVVHDGRIVAEEYAAGCTATTRFPGWSMSKSVVSALVGVLVAEGRLAPGDSALLSSWQSPDPRSRITVEDLLRMRSGLAFSEVYDDFSSDVIEMLYNQRDAAAYAARQPLSAAPGTVWSYSSGTTNILSAVVRRVVGENEYPDFPRRALFDPVGMASAILEQDASGTFVGSSFMMATARDWARFGQLYLQDGVWDGRRVLPEGWVRFCTSPTPQSPGGIYGAHWWLKLKPEVGGGTADAARIRPDAFFAIGHEGQTLTVVPSLRLVAVRLGVAVHIDAWNQAAFVSHLQDAL